MKIHNIPWQFFPWITVFLTGLICAVHIFVPSVMDPAAFRASYGITPGSYHTYITYGFLHADPLHLLSNTIGLLIFGAVVELQVRRSWYISAIAMSILAGALCVIYFPYPTLPDLSERVVGFSAAGWALKIIGLGVFIRFWGWGKGLFLGHHRPFWRNGCSGI